MSEVQVKESYFWTQIKAGLNDEHTHLCRIENTAGTGISDVNVCVNGLELWLELKVFHGKYLHFRTSQRIWITRRLQVGGTVWIVTRNGDDLEIYDAAATMAAPHKSYPEKKSFRIAIEDLPTPVYRCSKPFKWVEVRKVLFSSKNKE